jgi:hypothetical protein
VPYNDYQRFGTLFDRAVAWEEKQPLLKKAKGPKKEKRKKRSK